MTAPTSPQTSREHETAWLLVGSEGLWAADCLVPGCGWTLTTGGADAAITAGLTHADTHTSDTTDTTTNREVSR